LKLIAIEYKLSPGWTTYLRLGLLFIIAPFLLYLQYLSYYSLKEKCLPEKQFDLKVITVSLKQQKTMILIVYQVKAITFFEWLFKKGRKLQLPPTH
jgi:hypothetical protein